MYHGATTSILASSLWLNQDVAFIQSTLDTLAEAYFASQGKMERGAVAKSPEKRKTEDCKKAVTSVFFSGIIEL